MLSSANNFLGQAMLEVGSIRLTFDAVLRALFLLGLALLLAWAVRRIARRMQERVGEERASAVYVGAQVLRYIIVFAGISIAVSALGVDLTALSLFAGALGIGIGLGLQDVVRNFVCGIILLFDRSIEVGDFIELDFETRGHVVAIGPRATTVLTNDNVDILVPNADLLNGRLKNWTRYRTPRRIRIPFPVALGSDKERVRKAVLEAARSVPFTLPDEGNRRTQVWLAGFGESALEFELVVWPSLDAVKRPGSMIAAYNWAIDDALRRHEIEIPLPQREMRLRGFFGQQGEEGLRSWRGEETDAGTIGPASAQGRSVDNGTAGANDAARDIDEARAPTPEELAARGKGEGG